MPFDVYLKHSKNMEESKALLRQLKAAEPFFLLVGPYGQAHKGHNIKSWSSTDIQVEF